MSLADKSRMDGFEERLNALTNQNKTPEDAGPLERRIIQLENEVRMLKARVSKGRSDQI